MKRIVLTIMAVAALAACTKSEVAYEAPAEIGFNVVAGNMTKAVVDGETYPTDLNMYIYAWTTTDNNGNPNTATEANYIKNAAFEYKGVFGTYTGETDETGVNPNVWGGADQSYYWPNVKELYFAGYSASGNASTNATYNCQTDVLTISNYTPGMSGANDLMWFPKTTQSYGKGTDYVPVNMYHTCAWITFLVKGDEVTSNTTNPYTITSLKMTEVDQTATVACSNATTPKINWSGNTDKTGTTADYAVTLKNGQIALTQTPKDVETDAVYAEAEGTTSSNIVVIPQIPGKLTLTYTYKSSTGAAITETVENLDLALNTVVEDADANDGVSVTPWEAGKHYIYTITIKANEILIAPTPVDWTDGNFNVTVE